MLEVDEAKTELNRLAKEAMRRGLRAKSWKEKVASIARMNATAKVAQASMRRALLRDAEQAKEN